MNFPVPGTNHVMTITPLLALLVLHTVSIPVPARASNSNPAGVQVVKEVDLNRYRGKWYEIALIPVWFQKDCYSG